MPRLPSAGPVRELGAIVSAALWVWVLSVDGYAPAAWFALAPLFAAVDGAGALRGGLCATLWAIAATLGVAWWLPATVASFFEMGLFAAWGAFAVLALAVALPYALFGAAIGWMGKQRILPSFALAAGFGAAEFARAYGVGNPIALAATTQVGWLPAQSVDLWGPFGLGVAIAWTGALTARGLRDRHLSPSLRRELAVLAPLVALLLLYGELRTRSLGPQQRAGADLALAVVQPGLAAPDRIRPDLRADHLERQLQLTRIAAKNHAELVLWPEHAVDFYLRETTPLREELVALSRGMEAELVLGGPHYRYAEPQPDYFASVFVVHRGEVKDRYDKMRLVPFAESAPLGASLAAPRARYTPGERARLLHTRPATLGTLVCGEALFPDLARAHVRNGASLLINPSNDGWYGHPIAARHQLRAAALRAIETRRSVVRPTASGPSAVIDPLGRIERLGAPGVAASLPARAYLVSNLTPYVRSGDWAGWLSLVAAALPLLSRRPNWRNLV